MNSGQTSTPRQGRAGYGTDEPRTIIALVVAGVLAAVTGVLVAIYVERSNPPLGISALVGGPVVGFLMLVAASLLYWSNSRGKVREVEGIIADLPWGGGEIVLDLGCGRGLGMVKAATRLTTGFSVGLDLWKSPHVWGNRPSSVWANAEIEGVGGRVATVKGTPVFLPFGDSTFDAIISVTSIHRLVSSSEKSQFFSEVVRVLKEGGRVGFLEVGKGYEYGGWLRRSGMREITVKSLRFSSLPPFHVILARKPFNG